MRYYTSAHDTRPAHMRHRMWAEVPLLRLQVHMPARVAHGAEPWEVQGAGVHGARLATHAVERRAGPRLSYIDASWIPFGDITHEVRHEPTL